MMIQKITPFQKAIYAVETLSLDDREDVIEILQKRLAEERRDEIAANAREVLKSILENRANFGTVQDLKNDLLKKSCLH